MFAGKNILLGVSGGIAAYKAAALASALKKRGANVEVILTKNAREFITPLTFETLTGNAAITDTFKHPDRYDVAHVSLAKKTDVCIIAPATANIIGKMANGIADDMLSTTYLALKCPVFVAPAMNTAMYEHAAMQENLEKIKNRGCHIIEPGEGMLACGDVGKGRMAEPDEILRAIEDTLQPQQDYTGIKLLVTAGPTMEPIDPVRYISNRSSGKMGYAIAQAAIARGAQVTLVSGPVAIEPPVGANVVRVQTAAEMYDAVISRKADAQMIIKCAAVADYTPATVSAEKIKKGGEMTLQLHATRDILKELGANKTYFLVGFAAETQDMDSYARKKLHEKNLDMIVANDVSNHSIGFDSDLNAVTVYTRDGAEITLKTAPKYAIANRLLDEFIRAYMKG